MDDTRWFEQLRFQGELRPSQIAAIEVARKKLSTDHRVHIVAPPGTGKTILGLYLWAHVVRKPAVVFSPNSAIQMQWGSKVSLFADPQACRRIVSSEPQNPAVLTTLTYQSVTLPARAEANLQVRALSQWMDRLIARGEAKDPLEAQVWIADLKRHNPKYYEDRLGAYCKELRDELSRGGESLETLHRSSIETLQRLRSAGVGMVILDECHHLVGHWGRVLADAHELLDFPVVLGLTATPPDLDDKNVEDATRYREFFGSIDYEVPVPSVVKDGFLAPYQDLVYFVRPTLQELQFVANADDQVFALVEELCHPAIAAAHSVNAEATPDGGDEHGSRPLAGLERWLFENLRERRLPVGVMKSWSHFEKRDPAFADAARRFLLARGVELPEDVPKPRQLGEHSDSLHFDDMVVVLDRYVRHRLRRSAENADHQLADRIVSRLRLLGVQITESGTRACASPVGRILAYSKQKTAALIPILNREYRTLGDNLRAIVVTDFEKTSAVSEEIADLLSEEAGGAVAAFRMLLSEPVTDSLDPILVTGSSILIDDDLPDLLLNPAKAWLAQQGLEIELQFSHEGDFYELTGSGKGWSPRVYVALITYLFQEGITKCLVGTRGLLGEGWDANRVNVLIDLTTATTSTTVNQLRGRSIRLDPNWPEKVADNWDVVCIAPEFVKGLDDYRRMLAKHKTIFGVSEDGTVEKGVGHVHAALTELEPEGLEESVDPLNEEMLRRVDRRQTSRELWKIGQPYRDQAISAIEVRRPAQGGGFPPFKHRRNPWNDRSLSQAIGQAVLGALREAKLVSDSAVVHVGQRQGDYVRVFLADASPEESTLFADAVREALGPLDRPRYVIPRDADYARPTWLSNLLPEIVGRYFQRRERRTARLHAIPSVLARNRQLAAIYAKHWNEHVSPGEPIYSLQGAGQRLVADLLTKAKAEFPIVHQKEVFI